MGMIMRLLAAILFTVVLAFNTVGQTTPTVQVKTMNDLVGLRIPTINNRLTAIVSGRLTDNDGGGARLSMTQLFRQPPTEGQSLNLLIPVEDG